MCLDHGPKSSPKNPYRSPITNDLASVEIINQDSLGRLFSRHSIREFFNRDAPSPKCSEVDNMLATGLSSAAYFAQGFLGETLAHDPGTLEPTQLRDYREPAQVVDAPGRYYIHNQ